METRLLLIRLPALKIAIINQSLGLGYLAAVLEKEGLPVRIIDAPALNYNRGQIINQAKKINQQLLALPVLLKNFLRHSKHLES